MSREIKFRVWSEEDREYRTDCRLTELFTSETGTPATVYSDEGDRFDIEQYKELQEFYKGQAFTKDYDRVKKDYDRIKKEWYATRAYFDAQPQNVDVWVYDVAPQEERTGHATPKPLALCARGIKTSSREGEIVLDVFGGSGSTMIACEQLNRRCYMMELDPHYADVIIERWEKFTGKTALKIKEAA